MFFIVRIITLSDGKVLAKFEAPSRQFLFPAPSFTPKDDVNRELLLTRTSHFSVEKVKNLFLIDDIFLLHSSVLHIEATFLVIHRFVSKFQ